MLFPFLNGALQRARHVLHLHSSCIESLVTSGLSKAAVPKVYVKNCGVAESQRRSVRLKVFSVSHEDTVKFSWCCEIQCHNLSETFTSVVLRQISKIFEKI